MVMLENVLLYLEEEDFIHVMLNKVSLLITELPQ